MAHLLDGLPMCAGDASKAKIKGVRVLVGSVSEGPGCGAHFYVPSPGSELIPSKLYVRPLAVRIRDVDGDALPLLGGLLRHLTRPVLGLRQ
jgi:hypothetical protein